MQNTLLQDFSKIVTSQEHVKEVNMLLLDLMKFHEAREATYKLSFAKRGEVGIWMNVARKYDRLEELMAQYVEAGNVDHAVLCDTLADLALYSVKWLQILDHAGKEGFQDWYKRYLETEINKYDPEFVTSKQGE